MITAIYKHNDEYYYNILRKNMKKYRFEKNITQQDLADMTSTSRQYICDIENANRDKRPTIAIAGRIADAFDISLSELFKEDKTEEQKDEENSNN